MAMSKSFLSAFLLKTSSLSAHFLPATSHRVLGTASFATETKPGAGKGLNKLLTVSPALQAVVGDPSISRTQATKKIWAYIKAKNLQDPSDKRVIVCDEKLKKIFDGKDRVGMFEMARLLSPHLS